MIVQYFEHVRSSRLVDGSGERIRTSGHQTHQAWDDNPKKRLLVGSAQRSVEGRLRPASTAHTTIMRPEK